MSAGRDRAYSSLELVPRQCVYQTDRHGKPLPTDLGKQVVPYEGKQVVPHEGRQVSRNDDGIEVVAKEDSYADNFSDHHFHVHRPSRKQWILFCVAFGSIVILAAVLGPVLRIRHKHSAKTSFHPPATTVSPPATTIYTPSSTNSHPASNTSAPAPLPQRNIAALSFASNSVNNTRVYFQDNMGQIMEAANSAENTSWSISGTGIRGKNGSAIAAAVSRPGFPLVRHISSIPIKSY